MHEAGVCTEELPNSPKEGARVISILLQFSIWETHFIFMMYLYLCTFLFCISIASAFINVSNWKHTKLFDSAKMQT